MKIFSAYIIKSFSHLLQHMPRYLTPYVQKCALKITLWTQSVLLIRGNGKQRWSIAIKHEHIRAFFWPSFSAIQQGLNAFCCFLMQWSESVFAWLHGFLHWCIGVTYWEENLKLPRKEGFVILSICIQSEYCPIFVSQMIIFHSNCILF